MAKGAKDAGELVLAAEALEQEVVTLEGLSRSVRKMALNSEKSISRATKELNEVLSLPERLASKLGALAIAMESMQLRQQAALEPLASRAVEIQERVRLLGAHMHAFSELGKAAGEVTALLQSKAGDDSTVLADVKAQLTKIVEGATALHESARSDDFPDIAREADALKQRVAAARRRMES
jgi:hypothetical protein